MSLSSSRLTRHFQEVSLEAQPADGKMRVERELVFFGKIANFQELAKADSHEQQEQWEIRITPSAEHRFGGCARVRMIDGHKFILTTKTFNSEDADAASEVELEVSKDMFEQYKRLATGGMCKTRYVFKIDEQHFWEVDVYVKPNGDFEDWCKIDLEVQTEDMLQNRPAFPITLTDVIDAQWGERTEEQQAEVDELMKTVFVRPNAYPKTGG